MIVEIYETPTGRYADEDGIILDIRVVDSQPPAPARYLIVPSLPRISAWRWVAETLAEMGITRTPTGDDQ